MEREQTRVGFTSVAIPLVSPSGTTVAALSVTAPLFRADAAKYANLLHLVGRRITKTLAALTRE